MANPLGHVWESVSSIKDVKKKKKKKLLKSRITSDAGREHTWLFNQADQDLQFGYESVFL